MSRVLLTSFEPFGGFALNSSHEVARIVAASPPAEVQLDWLTLPVVAGLCVERAWGWVEQHRPDVVVALGQATGAAAVRLEDRGVNLDDFSMPDNAGNQPRKRPIIPGGPVHLRTTAPLERLLAETARAGLAVEHSLSAGNYVCNHLYYNLLHRAHAREPVPGVLFVHLPLLPEQVTGKVKLPSRPLDELVRTVLEVLRLCAAPNDEGGSSQTCAAVGIDPGVPRGD
jgi:pyroglutamyl-peptidase